MVPPLNFLFFGGYFLKKYKGTPFELFYFLGDIFLKKYKGTPFGLFIFLGILFWKSIRVPPLNFFYFEKKIEKNKKNNKIEDFDEKNKKK